MTDDTKPHRGLFNDPTSRHEMDASRLCTLIAENREDHIRHLRYTLAHEGGISVSRMNDHALVEYTTQMVRRGVLHVQVGTLGRRFLFSQERETYNSRNSTARSSAPKIARQELEPAPQKRTLNNTLNVTRDIVIRVSDEFGSELPNHEKLINGTRYILKTDLKEIRRGTIVGGRITERNVNIEQHFHLEFEYPE